MADRPRTFDEQLTEYANGYRRAHVRYLNANRLARAYGITHIRSSTIDYSDGYTLSFPDADSADVYIGARLSGVTHSDAISASLFDPAR